MEEVPEMLDFDSFDVISFDCYGTLIDWESGILNSIGPLLRLHGIAASEEEILSVYSRLERASQSKAFSPYDDILREMVRGFAECYEFNLPAGQENRLVDSLPNWVPFPETVRVLESLAGRYRLAIFSNISESLIAESVKQLGVEFDCIITADQTRTYKPNHHHFHLGLEKLEIPKERLLHVAESLYHDIQPTQELGIANVWVNRAKGRMAASGKATGKLTPDLEVGTLEELLEGRRF